MSHHLYIYLKLVCVKNVKAIVVFGYGSKSNNIKIMSKNMKKIVGTNSNYLCNS